MSYLKDPAAFGRLCVETIDGLSVINAAIAPAAFGRLCVETMGQQLGSREESQPPSGGCVLKLAKRLWPFQIWLTSRLRAAVC